MSSINNIDIQKVEKFEILNFYDSVVNPKIVKTSFQKMKSRLNPVDLMELVVPGVTFFESRTPIEVVLSKRCLFSLTGSFEVFIDVKTSIFGVGSIVCSNYDPSNNRGTFTKKIGKNTWYSILFNDRNNSTKFVIEGSFVFLIEEHLFEKDVIIKPLFDCDYEQLVSKFSYQTLSYQDNVEISKHIAKK